MIPYLHLCTYFLKKKHLFLAIIFCNFYTYLFCVKLFSPSEIIFTNDEHVFLIILVINLRVLCFDIYALPTMCTPYYPSRLRNFPCEHTHVFGMRCHCYILVGIISFFFLSILTPLSLPYLLCLISFWLFPCTSDCENTCA